jgi:DNA primase
MRHRDERDRREAARDLWDRASPATGTLVQTYLRARGIRLPMPDQLRFHPALKHPQVKGRLPVMLARIADEKGFCAVQRTFLSADGQAKAPVDDAKLGLGPMGAGAVRLFPAGDILGLAEGVETALSACQLYSLPVWATLSAARLSRIQIPEGVRQLTIFADAGDVGRREAFAAGDAYEHRGFTVEIITPAAHHEEASADDFNDIVQAHGGGRLPDRQGSV